jgi:hypothetical protein
MAEKDIQADDLKPPRRPDILRAKDIIPGSAPTDKTDGVSNTDIPRFDLADDIMSEHRRLTAGRRKGPGSPVIPVSQPPAKPITPPVLRPVMSRYGFSNGFHASSDPIIADIVAKDIEQFCMRLRA